MTDLCYIDCSIATMEAGRAPYGLIDDAALVVSGSSVAWVGKKSCLPPEFQDVPQQSLGGRLVTPTLIDCHTHLVFGGTRAQEFEQRLNGASYAEIAASGGGIVATVNATRSATDEELLASALTRLDRLLAEGVTVVEVKSGYGLSIAEEIRMLKVARALETKRPVKVVTSWLAAHALPEDYKGRADNYIDDVVIPGLKEAHEQGLVDAVDGFCETIGFTTAQIDRVFQAAKALGLPVKLHAEQLSDQKGALLAAKYHGLSADHLEYLAPDDVAAFARSGTVAVLLPVAFYALRETQLPPIAALRDNKVDMAIATDCNPGSAPCSSLLLAMNMACTLFSLTPEEALAGATRNAAKALGLSARYGSISPGKVAEFAAWDVSHPAELAYWMGGSPLSEIISNR